MSVASWFTSLKDTLDVMPDEEGWYQINVPLKKMVYDNYCRDVEEIPDTYTKVSPSVFYEVWREHFSNIKCRKFCRFAKCSFCVKMRQIIGERDPSRRLERQVAKDRHKAHLSWAHIRERGFYHKKLSEAIQNPDRFLSIASDGTFQMINGFPHFFEATKGDAKGKRLKIHTQVNLVHGRKPIVFLEIGRAHV